MCGRYQRRSDKQRIAEAFNSAISLSGTRSRLQRLCRQDAPGHCPGCRRTLQMMYCKFLPRFCHDPKKFKLSTTNAKADRLLENGCGRTPFSDDAASSLLTTSLNGTASA